MACGEEGVHDRIFGSRASSASGKNFKLPRNRPQLDSHVDEMPLLPGLC